MGKTEINLIESRSSCTLYSIHFLKDSMDEFQKFCSKFKDDLLYNSDLMRIVQILGHIGDCGVLERYFRPEGKWKNRVCALPVQNSKLRLYCLRLSDKILIIGNGGVKNTKTYQESEELKGYVLTLQKFDELLRQGEKDGSIIISETTIKTPNIFDL